VTTPGTLAVASLLAGGLAFTAVAVVGLYRLPDVYARAHATSKSETLGALLALSAAAVALGETTTTAKLAALALFVLVTSPTATHAIVRSADAQGVEPWQRPADERDEDEHSAVDDGATSDSSAGEGEP
jgi:multicomponent Na+:H+ antiporter subunit G